MNIAENHPPGFIPSRMLRTVEFTAKHGIVLQVDIRPGPESVDSMACEMREGRSSRPMGVVFDKKTFM